MKKILITLSVTFLLLATVVIIMHGTRHFAGKTDGQTVKYSLCEGRRLVAFISKKGDTQFMVEDEKGYKLFNVPVRNCALDSIYRDGKLAFRDIATGRTGFIDAYGHAIFNDNNVATQLIPGDNTTETFQQEQYTPQESTGNHNTKTTTNRPVKMGKQVDLQQMAHNNPFYKEASKVLSGKLEETDAAQRRVILNYCEHFRTAYTTKDIDFLRQIFSDRALIIVGSIIKPKAENGSEEVTGDEKVTYALRTKYEYLQRLNNAFAANKAINVKFSDFKIMRHPTLNGIYGVTLRQQYKSDKYADDGYIFLLWDFRNASMPLIHVRTWQPSKAIKGENDVIGIQDFNME